MPRPWPRPLPFPGPVVRSSTGDATISVRPPARERTAWIVDPVATTPAYSDAFSRASSTAGSAPFASAARRVPPPSMTATAAPRPHRTAPRDDGPTVAREHGREVTRRQAGGRRAAPTSSVGDAEAGLDLQALGGAVDERRLQAGTGDAVGGEQHARGDPCIQDHQPAAQRAHRP